MSKVIFKRTSYNYKNLKPILFEMIATLGEDLISKQDRVLIKPNLLMPAKPENAVITHPFVVRAVAEYVLSKGGIPMIFDSPATGSIEKIKVEGGYYKAFRGLDVEVKEFSRSIKVNIGEPFGSIEIAREVFEVDVIINLPKLKTHTGMLLTLGVKNLFGCIIGLKKPEWHLRSGIDREMFARLLVQICHAVNPSITIADGILAMEGQGPGKRGIPRPLGILVGGRDVFAVDMAICTVLGLDPKELLTHKTAKKLRLTSNEVYVDGDLNIVNDFKFPELKPLICGPKQLHKFIRKHMIQRPEIEDLLCNLCGECWQYCPAKAITCSNEKIDFDYDICIRCYCCMEICPHGALYAIEPFPARIMRRLSLLN